MTDQTRKPASANAPFSEGVECLAQGPTSALIATRVCTGGHKPVGLRWEVFSEGDSEPVRYGLCLAQPVDDFRVRVPVMGLKVGCRYQFWFQLGSETSERGAFHTTLSRYEALQTGSLAA